MRKYLAAAFPTSSFEATGVTATVLRLLQPPRFFVIVLIMFLTIQMRPVAAQW